MVELFDRCKADSPAAILACLRQSMVQWQGKEEPVDDQTVVIVRRNF